MKKFITYLTIFGLLITTIGLGSPVVKAEETTITDGIAFDLSNAQVGDVYETYLEDGSCVGIEVVNFVPEKITRGVEEVGSWSGGMPNGTWTLRPYKDKDSTTAYFTMVVEIADGYQRITSAYDGYITVYGGTYQDKVIRIVRAQPLDDYNHAFAQMTWTSVFGSQTNYPQTISAYLTCEVSTNYEYRLRWRFL